MYFAGTLYQKRRVPLDFFELKVAGGGGDTADKKTGKSNQYDDDT